MTYPKDKYMDQVRDFLELNGYPRVQAFLEAKEEHAELVFNLVTEEQKEWREAAVVSEDLIDSLCDLWWVLANGLILLGVASDKPLTLRVWGTTAKVNLEGPTSMVLFALRKRPLCARTLNIELNKALDYVVAAARANGYDFDQAMQRIYENNMSKFWTAADLKQKEPDATSREVKPGIFLVKRADGKILKPPGFKKVDLSDITQAARKKLGLADVPPQEKPAESAESSEESDADLACPELSAAQLPPANPSTARTTRNTRVVKVSKDSAAAGAPGSAT